MLVKNGLAHCHEEISPSHMSGMDQHVIRINCSIIANRLLNRDVDGVTDLRNNHAKLKESRLNASLFRMAIITALRLVLTPPLVRRPSFIASFSWLWSDLVIFCVVKSVKLGLTVY